MNLDRKITVIVGKSGFGKTVLSRALSTRAARVLIAEHRGEYGAQTFYDFRALVAHCRGRGFENGGSFRFALEDGGRDLDSLFYLAFALRDCTVVVEEADLHDFASTPHYREAAFRGRLPARISIQAVAMRPHLLAVDLRSLVTDLYAFNQSEDSSLRWLEPLLGDEVKKLPSLPPLHGLHYSLDFAGVSVKPFQVSY